MELMMVRNFRRDGPEDGKSKTCKTRTRTFLKGWFNDDLLQPNQKTCVYIYSVMDIYGNISQHQNCRLLLMEEILHHLGFIKFL